jgi:DNA topoisomerase I
MGRPPKAGRVRRMARSRAPYPPESARSAGLQYVTDRRPGIRRVRSGRTFRYIDVHGRTVRDRHTLQRIRSLVIPPAWEEVWICPIREGHLQAVGRDARGRKQYRYHPRWREVRDSTKYHRMIAFGKALPKIRARVRHDLASPGLTREKVLATIVRLLETTHIRIGNEEYSKENESFGLTTLRNRHVETRGSRVSFYFRGKSGKKHAISIEDQHLARIVRRLEDLPGYELFQYLDVDGQRHSIGSGDANAYLREIAGDDFSSKDFRTWNATVLAALSLSRIPPYRSKREANRNLKKAIEEVARDLGNTVAVCRKCYVHPAIIECYLQKSLPVFSDNRKHSIEAAVLRMLQKAARQSEPLKQAA